MTQTPSLETIQYLNARIESLERENKALKRQLEKYNHVKQREL